MSQQGMMHWLHPVNRRSSWYAIILLVPLLLVTGFASVFLLNHHTPAAHAASSFVTRSGIQFMLNGAPFEFAGSNNFYPMYSPPVMIDDLFANAQAMGLTVMRVWAFDDIGSLDGTTVPTISTVQKTTGVSYNGMYVTFGGVTTTHTDNGSTITYTYTLNSGQTVSPSTNLLAAAQFGGNGTAHSTTGDTWSITTTSGGTINTTSGHF